MTATLIDGKTIAADLRAQIAQEVQGLRARHALVPAVWRWCWSATIRRASLCALEVRSGRRGRMRSFDHRLKEATSQDELLALVGELNANPDVPRHPDPAARCRPHIDQDVIIQCGRPAQDVDGLHPVNAAISPLACRLWCRATPLGWRHPGQDDPSLAGRRWRRGGRPAPSWSANPWRSFCSTENATVTVAHSKTRDLASVCRRADLLFARVGRAQMVKATGSSRARPVIDVASTASLDRRQEPPASATSPSPRRAKWRRHHAVPAASPDDHRLPVAQHHARGVPHRRRAGAAAGP